MFYCHRLTHKKPPGIVQDTPSINLITQMSDADFRLYIQQAVLGRARIDGRFGNCLSFIYWAEISRSAYFRTACAAVSPGGTRQTADSQEDTPTSSFDSESIEKSGQLKPILRDHGLPTTSEDGFDACLLSLRIDTGNYVYSVRESIVRVSVKPRYC